MGMFPKETKTVVHDLFGALVMSVAEVTIIIMEPITAKVKGDLNLCSSASALIMEEGSLLAISKSSTWRVMHS